MRRLLVNYKAADLTPKLLEGDVTCHVLDIYHRHAIEKVHHAKAICSAHLPTADSDGAAWEEIWFKTGPKLLSGELSLDLLQECIALVGGDCKSPKFHLEFVGRERDRNDLMDKVKDRIDRKFAAIWPASVPGGEKLMFTSFPGCFCHRRLDEGGLALAEVVSKEMNGAAPDREAGPSLLDMGCGCGLVGFLVKSVHPEVKLTMVDSHSRAIEAVGVNSAAFAMPVEAVLADNGSPARLDGTFDIFVGNPPYYSDYRIAEVFLETAKRALKPGGVCYTVCKNAAGLEPVQKRYFPEVEIIRRRGYAVLKSIQGL